jgi:hypothetical protein
MRLSAIFAWLLEHTRPEFHYATMVLACSAAFVIMAILPLALLFEVLNYLFGVQFRIRTEFLNYLIGTMALGGLAAGYLRHHLPANAARRWLVAAVFGGATAATLGGLTNLKWGGSIALGLLIGFAVGALFGVTLLWAFLKDARKEIKGAALYLPSDRNEQ